MKDIKQLLAPNQILIATLSIYICILIFSILDNPGAIYLSDELGYASKAAHLAGHSNLLSSSWHAGYSFMLAPIFMIFGVNEALWPAISIFNLALITGSILLWISTLRVLGYKKENAVLISLSSLVCFSTWGFASWIFVNPALQLMIAIMARGLLLRERIPRLLIVSIAGGLAYWIHPTGLLIAASAWIVAIAEISSIRDRKIIKAFAITVIGIAITAGLVLVYKNIHSAINISMGGDGGHYGQQISSYINEIKNETKQTIAELGTGLINGLANLSIATFGYSMLFLAPLFTKKGNKKEYQTTNQKKTIVFIGITSFLLLLFSSLLAINQPGDYQHMLHQRYTSPAIQSLWILGLSTWINRENQINLSSRLIICLSPILVALVIGSVRWDYNNRFSIIDGMSSGTSVISNLLDSQNQPLAGLAIGSIVIIVIQSLTWKPKLVLAGFLTSIVGWNVNQTRGKILESSSKQPDLIDEARKLSNTNKVCIVGIQTDLNANESDNLYEFYLSSNRITRLRNTYADRKSYNQFYSPDPSNCDYIIAPLDIHVSSERNDLDSIIRKLSQCKIDKVDDRLGWALTKCRSNAKSNVTTYTFRTSSNGAITGPLDTSVKPIRVYTEENLKYEDNKLSYAYIAPETNNNIVKVLPCKNLESKKERRSCKSNRQIIKEPTPGIPLIWGLYIQDLKAGNYKLIASGLKVYQGDVTVEIVDNTINRLNSISYNQKSPSNAGIPFTLTTEKQQVELRIEASADAIFSPPSHWIITK
jgi:hypothetical protein